MDNAPQIEGVRDLAEIGRGGFGVVYLGTETNFDRQIAVKVLLPSLDERSRKRFERERRAMGSVSGHPNIVTVYRGGSTPGGQPYLLMEYLPGGSLNDRLQAQGPFDWRTAATIGWKLSGALNQAHKAGILHRDVKPANVLLTATGEPKLGDFGIARLDDGQDSRTGSVTASIAHAAPEILDGQRGDERSDLYSLASTVYALAAGHAPFSQDADVGIAALLSRIANDQPPELNLGLEAGAFQDCLRKALSKNPEDRHATVAEFGTAIQRSIQSLPGYTGATDADRNRLTSLDSPANAARANSVRQMGFIALLALAIAGFGGWAVARAVLNSNDDIAVQPAAPTAPTAISFVEPTSATEPTAVPVTPVPATPVPATPLPATAPPATSVPATPEPSSALAGYTRVEDFSGAISVDVPDAWSFTVQDGSTIDPTIEGLETVRVLSAGGTVQELSADISERDLTLSGIYVFAARIGLGANSEGVLDVALMFWDECDRGDRSEILLNDGNAAFQILECERSEGDSSGIVVLGLTPRDDPEVGVTVFVQFAEIDDLAALPTILTSLDINPSNVPPSNG